MRWPKKLDKQEMDILKSEWRLMGGRAYDVDYPFPDGGYLPYWKVAFGRHEDMYGAIYELKVGGEWELKMVAKPSYLDGEEWERA